MRDMLGRCVILFGMLAAWFALGGFYGIGCNDAKLAHDAFHMSGITALLAFFCQCCRHLTKGE